MYGELCDGGRRFATAPSPLKEKRWKKAVWKGLSLLTTWIGLALVGLLALPAGILGLFIAAIWSLTNRVAGWLHRKGEDSSQERLSFG